VHSYLTRVKSTLSGYEFKHHLMDWDMVCTPIANGGLGGLGSLFLLTRLFWAHGCGVFELDESHLWRCC
jgi:hypothetical protein